MNRTASVRASHLALTVLLMVIGGCATSTSDESPPEVRPDTPAGAPKNQPLPVASRGVDATVIQSRIPTPSGFDRLPARVGSFGAWLRGLPLRPGRPAVYLYNGRMKMNQAAHFAVLDVDVGSKDLQQCADAIIRLRAEFLFSGSCADEIAFNFTSGHTARWADWRNGSRPQVTGNHVVWAQTARYDDSYMNFRRYLDTVFTYAGSASLEQELDAVADPSKPEIGDIFIEGGSPGHAVLVVDVAEDAAGERVFLLAQSYMPAQDIHILKSFDRFTPWYTARSEGVLNTPEWTFSYRELKRFSYTACERDGDRTSD
ncbi:MAG: DUF4846 domain-containing protein [Candidatus Eisenbacteria bacterium]